MIEYLIKYDSFVFRGLFESLVLIFIVILILRKSDLLLILSKNKKYPLIILFFIFFNIGQITDRFQYQYPQLYDTYPFIRFAMYQASPEVVELTSYRFCFYEKDSNKSCNEINITKIYSSIGLPPLSSRMNYLVQNYPETSNEILLWLSSLERLKSSDVQFITFEKEFLIEGVSNFIELERLYVQN
jgi:hypothetical protein